MKGILLQIDVLNKDYQKALKKLTIFFFRTACRLYSYVIRMSLVYTCMLSVCHLYVLVCHPYATRLWFYHEPLRYSVLLLCVYFLKGDITP